MTKLSMLLSAGIIYKQQTGTFVMKVAPVKKHSKNF